MGLFRQKWVDLTEAIASWMQGNGDAGAAPDGSPSDAQRATAVAHPRDSMMPRVFAGLLLLTAVLMLTFVGAATLVKAFTGKNPTRLTLAMAEQHASSEYRKARVRCQLLSAAAREACIAEAHAAEERARAVALVGGSQKRSYVSQLRAQTDAAIDAGDRDSIIVEPACNIVARGQGSLCEIQHKPNVMGTNLIPATMNAEQYATAFPLKSRMQRYVPVQSQSQYQPAERMAAVEPSRPALDRIFQFAWSARQ